MARELNFFDEQDGWVSVLLPFALKGVLDYRFSGERPEPGRFVRVPLAGRPVTGVVWENQGEENEVSSSKLKAIYEVLKVPSLTGEQRRFVEWVANYTISPPGNVLKMCMGSPEALKPLPTRMLYSKGRRAMDPARLTPARLQVLEAIDDGKLRTIKETAKKAGVSEAVVRGLIKLGLIEGVEQTRDRPYLAPDPNKKGPALTEEQKKAVADLKNVLGKGFQPLALEGVTGSGKTEVYFEAIAEILQQPDSQILVLLPEIALTNQWLDRFENRFGAPPVEWHSDLGKAERRRAWRAMASGKARLVVGARSALFLPFKKLKLVIVDEEHDSSFKQEEGVLYHARDMALVRAQIAECPIILSSATLSYETLANIERGRFGHVTLKHRYGGASLPDLSAIDMRTRAAPSGHWLSPDLVEALTATLGRGEQAMLFLNRRGYAPLTLCRTCGERMECPNCTAWMVEHRLRRHLMCHHCGHSVPIPKFCPECGHEDSLTVCGPGVERLEEEVANLFPSAKRLVMTSDTMTSPARAAEMVARIAAGEVDIIIGTQVITKGYHFPKLTLVGVIDADLGLKGGDLRAAERTYQQLEQVAGRAGREKLKGHVLVQTYMPDNPVMAALLAGDKEAFIREDMAERKTFNMPPYGRLASILVTGPDLRKVEALARELARRFPKHQGVSLFGPAQAPLARLHGRYRYRLLLKTGRKTHLQNLIRSWMKDVKTSGGLKVKVDIDPYSFL